MEFLSEYRKMRIPGSGGAVYSLFALLIAAISYPVLGSFWLYDDTYNLRHIASHPVWQFFFIPHIWRKISICYLTPWMALSYWFDIALFGLRPFYFYLHQLVAIWIVSAILYKLLRLFMDRWFALFAVLLFLVSAPAAAVAQMIMTRHYVEGMFLCLGAILLFSIAVKKDRLYYSVLAAVVYFLAMSAKEIYVPLGIVMIFLPEERLRKRIVCAIPLAVALLAYFLWRAWMLGDLIGGPGLGRLFGGYTRFDFVSVLMKNVYASVTMMSGLTSISRIVNLYVLACAGVLCCLSIFFLLKEKKYFILIFFAVLFFAIYAVPLSAYNIFDYVGVFPAYRIDLTVAVFISVVLASSANYLYKKAGRSRPGAAKGVFRVLVPLSLLGLGLMVAWNSSHWIATQRQSTVTPLVKEARFFMKAEDDILIVAPAPVFTAYYYEDLGFFRRSSGMGKAPSVVYGYFAHVEDPDSSALKGLRVFEYQPDRKGMADITSSYLRERSRYLSRVRKLPLDVEIKVDHGRISYLVGPSDSGRYFILLGYRPGRYCTVFYTRRNFAANGATGMHFYCRVGWESPKGWLTFSPEWFLDLSGKRDVAWHRK